jgi:hypothetical protein
MRNRCLLGGATVVAECTNEQLMCECEDLRDGSYAVRLFARGGNDDEDAIAEPEQADGDVHGMDSTEVVQHLPVAINVFINGERMREAPICLGARCLASCEWGCAKVWIHEYKN